MIMILLIIMLVLALLVLVLTLTTAASRLLGLPRADEVTAVFCGSKKSLANGAPIASVLFGANPAMGMIMLPLMLYHQAQLILCTILARRYAAQAEVQERRRRPHPDPALGDQHRPDIRTRRCGPDSLDIGKGVFLDLKVELAGRCAGQDIGDDRLHAFDRREVGGAAAEDLQPRSA